VEQPLSIALAQPRCTAYDVTANALAHAEAVRAADARVVVFPEMSLMGYELEAVTVVPDDERLAPIVAACAEMGMLALGGAPVPGPRIGVHLRNAACGSVGDIDARTSTDTGASGRSLGQAVRDETPG
jgi:predicted amidohydrolase